MAQLIVAIPRFSMAAVFMWSFASCYTAPITSSGEMALLVHQSQLDLRTDGLQQLDNDGEILTITADQAIELALKSDPNLKVRRAFLSRAVSRISAAGQLRNPEIRYSQEKLEDFIVKND